MAYLSSNFLFIEMPGGGELLIIVIVILLLFGGKKIPELMRGLGKGIREFNDAKSNVTKELEEGMKETPRTNNSTVNTTPNPSDNSDITSSSNAVSHHDQ